MITLQRYMSPFVCDYCVVLIQCVQRKTQVALDYLDSAVGLGAVDEKLFVARSRCLTSLERQAITINCQSWTAGTVLTILISVLWTLSKFSLKLKVISQKTVCSFFEKSSAM